MAARDDEHAGTSTLRATAHPVRLQMLSLLTGNAMSAAEVARELGITHANASYHLRFLADAGVVVEAGEEKIRGGVAKRYRHPWDAGLLDQATPEDSALYVRALAEELVRRHSGRREGRSLLVDADLWVPEEVWAETLELLERASRLVHESAGAPRSPGRVRVSVTVGAFLMGEGDGTDAS